MTVFFPFEMTVDERIAWLLARLDWLKLGQVSFTTCWPLETNIGSRGARYSVEIDLP